MSNSALVIGYGSIGQRHADILSQMNGISQVTVLSSQSNLAFTTIRSFDEIDQVAPDYVVVASNTALHYKHLADLEKKLDGKVILMEKPLFDKHYHFVPSRNSVWIGYVLRFHPLLKLIKEHISGRPLWNIHVFCGSYLPEWRPGRDYRETSSARKGCGGGVLLDLSHELDYVQWLAGRIALDYVYRNKVSSLEIETEDLLTLNGHTRGGTRVQISLNYFTRQPIRQIIIDGESISIQADLISGRAKIHLDGQVKDYDWSDLEMNALFLQQHKAVLAGDTSQACTYKEGLKIMSLIDQIMASGSK